MTTTRRLAVGAVGAVLLGTVVGVVSPTAAYADQELPSGAYQETDSAGTFTWNFTPCGPDCTRADSPDDKTVRNIEFHLADGRWTGTGSMPLTCPDDGSPISATINYRFDAATLAGDYDTMRLTNNCSSRPGGPAPGKPFQLTKLG
jgi:hypothetical protein